MYMTAFLVQRTTSADLMAGVEGYLGDYGKKYG